MMKLVVNLSSIINIWRIGYAPSCHSFIIWRLRLNNLFSLGASNYDCIALSFMYGQRSTTELDAARALTQRAGVEHRVINIDLGNLGGSALQTITLMFQIMNKSVFL
jgi:hypothetical protein